MQAHEPAVDRRPLRGESDSSGGTSHVGLTIATAERERVRVTSNEWRGSRFTPH